VQVAGRDDHAAVDGDALSPFTSVQPGVPDVSPDMRSTGLTPRR
jgi:hypothetical protein